MPDNKQVLMINNVVDKFSVLICLWVITELNVADVTSWGEGGAVSGYITFDPECFKFAHRYAGDALTQNEYVMGIQSIDLHGLRDIALSDLPEATSNRAEEFEAFFRELYIGEVLRYWMFEAGINDLLTGALGSVDSLCAQQCLRNIEMAYDSLVIFRKKGNLIDQVMDMRKQVIADEYHDFGTRFLH